MTDIPKGIDNPTNENAYLKHRVESPDGTKVFLFRYENPNAPRQSSGDARDELVGTWFTDSPSSLKTYIKARPPGGNVLILAVDKDKLEGLMAVNHPQAQNMDIEPLDNYIIGPELLKETQTIAFPVTSRPTNKFAFEDWEKVNKAVNEIVENLQPK